MKKYVLYVVIVVLLMMIASGGTYIFMNSKNNNVNNENKVNESDKNDSSVENNEQITLSDEELEEYLSYVPVSYVSYIYNDEIISGAYKEKYINIGSINKKVLVGLVIANNNWTFSFNDNEEILGRAITTEGFDYRFKTKNYYPLSYINSKLKVMYNYELKNLKNATSEEDSFNIGGMGYYYENENVIQCGGGSNGYEKVLNSIENYEIRNNELIIYEYASELFINFENLTSLHDYYTEKEVDISKICNDRDNIEKCAKNYFNNHKTEFTKYKHTFKKNDIGYYWYSTEVV